MNTESKNTDQTTTTNHAHAREHIRGRADARALTFNYGITAVTQGKTFRERQISICLDRTSSETDVNTKLRARACASASRDLALDGAGTLHGQT